MTSKQPPNFDSMRNTFIPPKNDNIIVNKTRKIANKETKPNIMEQIISYNEKSTSFLLNQLTEEIKDQKELNKILNDKNFDDNIQEINSFVEENKDIIPEQTKNLENIFNELKNIINENNELKEDQLEYKELLQNEEVIKISNDMIKLKSLKNDIILFLQSNGIHM